MSSSSYSCGLSMIQILTTTMIVTFALEQYTRRSVYNTDKYKDVIERLKLKKVSRDRITAQAEKQISVIENDSKLTEKERAKYKLKQTNKITEATELVANYTADTTAITSRSKMLGLVSSIGMYMYLNSTFSGEIIGVLPFIPPGFLRFFTQRSLRFDNLSYLPQVCSFSFIYTLINLGPLAIFKKFYSDKQEEAGGVLSVLKSKKMQNIMKKVGYSQENLDDVCKIFE